MLKVTFESNVKDLKELKKELEEFLWRLDHHLPTFFSLQGLDWIKEQYEKKRPKT